MQAHGGRGQIEGDSYTARQNSNACSCLTMSTDPSQIPSSPPFISSDGLRFCYYAFCRSGRACGEQRATGDLVFPLRCRSSYAWGCPHKGRVVVSFNFKTISTYFTKGWPHSHGGELQLKRGLPPQVCCVFVRLCPPQGHLRNDMS